MNRRQKIIVSVVGIFIVLLALVGLTYGYFLTRIQGNTNTTSITVTTADLKLVYGDGNGNITPSGVIMPDNNNFIMFSNNTDSKTFTVTNDGNATVENYVVVLEDISVTYASNATLEDGTPVTAGQQTTFNRPEDFVYVLTCKAYSGYGTDSQTEIETGCNGRENETALPMTDNILVTNTIDEDVTHAYELKIKYLNPDINQSKDMNKTFGMKVNIYNFSNYNPYSDNTDSLAYNIINNSMNKTYGTKLQATPDTIPGVEPAKFKGEIVATADHGFYGWNSSIKYGATASEATNNGKTVTGADDVEKCESVKDQYISDNYWDGLIGKVLNCTEDGKPMILGYVEEYESVIAKTEDDYGLSYYYRGDVKDNFVNFAGMCWRIVRIQGDGSIKLILDDQYAECDDKETTETEAVYTGNGRLNSFSYGTDKNGKVNYLKPSLYRHIADEGPYFNKNIVEVAYYFQTNQLANHLNKLKAGDWCISTPNTKQPTLKCNGTIMNEFEELIYEGINYEIDDMTGDIISETPYTEIRVEKDPMYVATLTADEIIYAGATVMLGTNEDAFSKGIYLIKNNYPISSLSLRNEESFYELGNAFLTSYDGDYSSNFRPAILLKSGIEIIDGEGTIEEPFVIEE